MWVMREGREVSGVLPAFLTGMDDGGGWGLIHSLSAAVGVK